MNKYMTEVDFNKGIKSIGTRAGNVRRETQALCVDALTCALDPDYKSDTGGRLQKVADMMLPIPALLIPFKKWLRGMSNFEVATLKDKDGNDYLKVRKNSADHKAKLPLAWSDIADNGTAMQYFDSFKGGKPKQSNMSINAILTPIKQAIGTKKCEKSIHPAITELATFLFSIEGLDAAIAKCEGELARPFTNEADRVLFNNATIVRTPDTMEIATTLPKVLTPAQKGAVTRALNKANKSEKATSQKVRQQSGIDRQAGIVMHSLSSK